MSDQSLILNAKQTAALLGVSTTTLWKMRKEGKVKELENFKPCRFSRAHIEQIASTNIERN